MSVCYYPTDFPFFSFLLLRWYLKVIALPCQPGADIASNGRSADKYGYLLIRTYVLSLLTVLANDIVT